MTRKLKVGIDYFSHDVDMMQDIKVKLIKAKHGLIGYAIYLRLLEEIYRDCGYFLKLTDDFNILFSDDNNIPLDDYINVLNDCIEKGLFDKGMYEKHNILTSERIQKNYCSATERRKESVFIKDYLLVDVNSLYSLDRVNVIIKALNVDINPLNSNKSTQSKVKEKKENNTYTQKEKSYPEQFNELWKSYPNTNGVKSRTYKNYVSSKKMFSLTDEEICKACLNSAKKRKNEGNKDHPYQLSNVLGEKYRDELPELVNYSTPETDEWEDEFDKIFN